QHMSKYIKVEKKLWGLAPLPFDESGWRWPEGSGPGIVARLGSLRVDHFYGGVPPVSGAAAHRQIHFALVRRRAGSLDYVRPVFSDRSPRRICLRAFQFPISKAARPGSSPHGPAAGRPGAVADHAGLAMETGGRRQSGDANSRI